MDSRAEETALPTQTALAGHVEGPGFNSHTGKKLDYVRKGRRWEMKEEKYTGEAGGRSQVRRQEERAEGKEDRQAPSRGRGSLSTGTQHHQ